MFFVWIIILVLGVVVLVCAWELICNERTSRHRQFAIKVASEEAHRLLAQHKFASYEDPWKLYEAVTYDQHMQALVLLRDPWSLYPPEFQQLITRVRSLELYGPVERGVRR